MTDEIKPTHEDREAAVREDYVVMSNGDALAAGLAFECDPSFGWVVVRRENGVPVEVIGRPTRGGRRGGDERAHLRIAGAWGRVVLGAGREEWVRIDERGCTVAYIWVPAACPPTWWVAVDHDRRAMAADLDAAKAAADAALVAEGWVLVDG